MLNNRIVFVTPPYERIAPGYEFVRHITNKAPSLGLLNLAAEVRESGYEPSIIESDVFNLSAEAVVEKIVSEAPSFVGITLFTVGVWAASRIAGAVKEALPETVVIVGGPHISSMGSETIQRFENFDFAITGEGEKPLIELLDTLRQGGEICNVHSLIYRDNGRVCRSQSLPINLVLDELALPAWDLLPNFPKSYLPAIYDFPRGPVGTIAASRGCPFHCRFCDTSTFGAKIRRYSPRVVFDLMKNLQDTYGIRHVMFVDDLFLSSASRTKELCNYILEAGLKMTWSCAARVDSVKPDLLTLMKRAGCWEISFGLESGSNEMLKKMDKIAEVERSEQALKWADEAGIRTKGLFILGYPGETPETVEMTKDFIRRIPMKIMNLTKFTPYPGSPIYRDLYGTNIRQDHWEKMNGMNFVWTTEAFTHEELDAEYQSILRGFYSRPRMLLYYTLMTLRYPNHLVRLSRFLMGFFLAKIRSFLSGRRGMLMKPPETFLDSGV